MGRWLVVSGWWLVGSLPSFNKSSSIPVNPDDDDDELPLTTVVCW